MFPSQTVNGNTPTECQARAFPWETASSSCKTAKPPSFATGAHTGSHRGQDLRLAWELHRFIADNGGELPAQDIHLFYSLSEENKDVTKGRNLKQFCLDASFLSLDAAYVEQYFPYDHDASRSFLCILIFCLRAAMGPDIGSPLEHCGAFRFCRDGCMLATRCSIVDCYDAIDGH